MRMFTWQGNHRNSSLLSSRDNHSWVLFGQHGGKGEHIVGLQVEKMTGEAAEVCFDKILTLLTFDI